MLNRARFPGRAKQALSSTSARIARTSGGLELLARDGLPIHPFGTRRIRAKRGRRPCCLLILYWRRLASPPGHSRSTSNRGTRHSASGNPPPPMTRPSLRSGAHLGVCRQCARMGNLRDGVGQHAPRWHAASPLPGAAPPQQHERKEPSPAQVMARRFAPTQRGT